MARTDAAVGVFRPDEYYTVAEIADRLGINQKTVKRRLLYSRGCRYVQLGRTKLIPGGELLEFLEGGLMRCGDKGKTSRSGRHRSDKGASGS